MSIYNRSIADKLEGLVGLESFLPEGKYCGANVCVEDVIKGNYQYMVDSVEAGLFELNEDGLVLLSTMKTHMERGGDAQIMSFNDTQRARTRCVKWLDSKGLTLEDRDLDIKVTDEDQYMDHIS